MSIFIQKIIKLTTKISLRNITIQAKVYKTKINANKLNFAIFQKIVLHGKILQKPTDI